MTKRTRMTFDACCEASGLHYTELAAKFGLSVSQVYRIRANGTKRPETAKRIEQITSGKVRATVLLGMEDARRRLKNTPRYKDASGQSRSAWHSGA